MSRPEFQAYTRFVQTFALTIGSIAEFFGVVLALLGGRVTAAFLLVAGVAVIFYGLALRLGWIRIREFSMGTPQRPAPPRSLPFAFTPLWFKLMCGGVAWFVGAAIAASVGLGNPDFAVVGYAGAVVLAAGGVGTLIAGGGPRDRGRLMWYRRRDRGAPPPP